MTSANFIPKVRGELPTPCLVLDLDRFEATIDKMRRHAEAHSIGLRPHAKTHKCVEIARHQMEADALGICAATIAEAEFLARGGIHGLLIASELVGKPKVSRLIRLVAKQSDTMVVVDNAENVLELDEAAEAAGLRLPVLIDLDAGSNRTGTQPGDGALALAHAIRKVPNLQLQGICSYAAHSSHTVGFEARRLSSHTALAKTLETWEMLLQAGFELKIPSGGSTGTYNIDPALGVLTELQVGSYIFMDADYRRIGGSTGEVYDDFAPSLTVLSTVIHRSGSKAVLDAGYKALATDRTCGRSHAISAVLATGSMATSTACFSSMTPV